MMNSPKCVRDAYGDFTQYAMGFDSIKLVD